MLEVGQETIFEDNFRVWIHLALDVIKADVELADSCFAFYALPLLNQALVRAEGLWLGEAASWAAALHKRGTPAQFLIEVWLLRIVVGYAHDQRHGFGNARLNLANCFRP